MEKPQTEPVLENQEEQNELELEFDTLFRSLTKIQGMVLPKLRTPEIRLYWTRIVLRNMQEMTLLMKEALSLPKA